MAWTTSCECGYESTESFERHFDAVEDIANHLIRDDCNHSTTDTTIEKVEDANP